MDAITMIIFLMFVLLFPAILFFIYGGNRLNFFLMSTNVLIIFFGLLEFFNKYSLPYLNRELWHVICFIVIPSYVLLFFLLYSEFTRRPIKKFTWIFLSSILLLFILYWEFLNEANTFCHFWWDISGFVIFLILLYFTKMLHRLWLGL